MADPAPNGGPGADFSMVRYAMCWEDADILLAGLDVQPGDRCLSIGSGGENALSLLTRDPERVTVVDLSPAQLACLELKVAVYRRLDHRALLELIGALPGTRGPALYAGLRGALTPACRAFWDARPDAIAAGIGASGKFERYLALFRRLVLPLIHRRATVEALFVPRDRAARRAFYDRNWDNRRWRWLFQLFFSRPLLGRLGRDPSFFAHVHGRVAVRLLARARHALRDLDPALNPYLQWIANGAFGSALPHALRAENFAPIRDRLDRLEWRRASVGQLLAAAGGASFDRYNLSDVFEYLAQADSDALFAEVARTGRQGGRVAYWNMLAVRRRPPALADRLLPLVALGRRLHREDRAFFYRAFRVDALR